MPIGAVGPAPEARGPQEVRREEEPAEEPDDHGYTIICYDMLYYIVL